MDCQEAGEALASYALNALAEEDATALEEHLDACPACRLALEQDQKVAQQLATSVNLVDPPSNLKGRLLAKVDAHQAAQQRPAGEGQPPRATRLGGVALWRNPWRVAFVGIAAVALFLLAWTVYQAARVSDLQDENAQLASDIRRQWDALAFVSASKVQTVKLAATDAAPQAKGTIFIDRDDNKAFVMASHLPAPAPGQVYKLWMWRTDRSLVELATFRSAPNGYGMWAIQPAESLEDDATWRLTLQPAGGESKPGGQPILDGRAATPAPPDSNTGSRPSVPVWGQ